MICVKSERTLDRNQDTRTHGRHEYSHARYYSRYERGPAGQTCAARASATEMRLESEVFGLKHVS